MNYWIRPFWYAHGYADEFFLDLILKIVHNYSNWSGLSQILILCIKV